ncbi:MAG: PAS domain-containing protein [Magnetospirillum sp.]|nr:PAS domain-containing protein [Magnetospirillum sp.]
MIARLRRHMTLTRAWLGLIMLLCLAVLVWDVGRAHQQNRKQTVERLVALAKVVESRASLTFQTVDMLLRDSASQLPPDSAQPGDQDYHRYLMGRSFLHTEQIILSVVSADGVVLHSSKPELVGRPVGKREYLDHFRAHPEDDRLFISSPSVSVANNPIIFTARAVRHEDGSLRAVVVTGIKPDILASLVRSALPTETSGAIAVQNRDHVILARLPELAQAAPGTRMLDNPANKRHLTQGVEQSVHHEVTGPDGVSRLVVLRQANSFGLLVVVTVANGELMEPVWNTLIADSLFLIIVGGVVIVLGRFLGIRERQRQDAQEQVARARDYYMRVLDNLPVLIWRSDSIGRIDYVNGTLQGFTGSQDAELSRSIHPDDLGAWRAAAARRHKDGGSSELEYRLLRQDGEYRWMHELAQPFPHQDGSFAGHLAACLDVTDARQAQDKLTQSNAELEQFAYVASHDLREPLRMISSYMGLIERRLGDAAGDDLREFLAFAKDGATRMDKLILDLLQYSRIGRMSAPKSLLDMSECLALALTHLGGRIDESHAHICVGEMPRVFASEDDMVRLFQNLIGNAIKYSRPDTPPHVAITCDREAGAWRFSIQDNGIGIDHGYFDRVFRIFQRLHGRDEHGGGSGIGLSICKKIVENHDGRIWVDSPGPGLGTTFYFTLPAHAAPPTNS